MPAIAIYDLADAKKTILRRTQLEEFPISEHVQTRIRDVFGAELTPEQAVRQILTDVRSRGDAALIDWTARLDGAELRPEQLVVTKAEIQQAYDAAAPEAVDALRFAAQRIEAFHRRQPVTSWFDRSMGGLLGQVVTPIARVGIYGPSGSAPLPSSILMSAIPARVAGVQELVVCSPPSRRGEVNPYLLIAADIAQADCFYKLGGAQAIAAMAYGSETVHPVDKIFGPGNLFVVLAKRAVFGVVGIDGIPGPTETLIIADHSADPAWAAADLLAQAEHDLLASAILLTPDARLARSVQAEVARQMSQLSRADITAESLQTRGGIVLVSDLNEAVETANAYAAEHLCLLVDNPWQWVSRIRNAGGIFLGERSFEVLGDYVAGPSHVMPTGGTARFASPLNVLDFIKFTSLVSLDPHSTAQLSAAAAQIAEIEGLTAHAAAALLRTHTG